jgi:cell division protein FtsW (lipid II flippase)
MENISTVLPNGATDNLLTWTIHRFGWLAGAAMAALIILLLAWMGRKALRQRGMLGCLLAVAAVCILGVQVCFYVLYNLGFYLVGPLSLPLLSWGKHYQIVNMALIGLALSVFREEQLPRLTPVRVGERRRPAPELVSWQNGDLVIRLSQWKKAK